jgi:hypothetical protein
MDWVGGAKTSQAALSLFIHMKQPIPLPNNPHPPLALPIMAELMPRGDGTYILKPRKAPTGLDTWITPKRAAELIGIQWRSVYRLLDATRPLLVYKRPLKAKFLISLKSVLAFIEATNDPDFWDDKLQQEQLVKSVLKTTQALRSGEESSVGTCV